MTNLENYFVSLYVPIEISRPNHMNIQSKFCFKAFSMMAIIFFAQLSFGQSGDDVLDFLPPILAVVNNKNVSSISDPANLCDGFFVDDKTNRSMPAFAKPTPLTTYTDPVFGSNITRISNADAISSEIIRTLYSTIQSWNADESRLILWHRGDGHYLYDGKNYALLERLNVAPADIEQLFWSTTDPDVFIYPNEAVGSFVPTSNGDYRLEGNELIEYNIATGLYRVIKNFNSLCAQSGNITGGNDIQMPSYDDDVIGLRCGGLPFTYQISSDVITVMPDADLSESQQLYAPGVLPSGQRSYHFGTIRDSNLQVERSLSLGQVDEHSSLGRMHNGNDAYFATAFDPTLDGSCDGGIGSLIVHDATNGDCRILVGQTNGYPYTLSGTHMSALAHQNPGWAVVSSVGYGDEGDSLLEQELFLANTDPNDPQVCRIAHHRSSGRLGSIGYFAEPHPVLSPTGTRILFNSDWNNTGKVDVYVIELPTYTSN